MSSDRNSSNGLQPETKRPSAQREPVQAKLLHLVATEVEERLAQSLHNVVRLTLGMERQDDRVRPATVVQLQRSREVLDPGTRIVEVFDRPEIARQLLILGEPGSGKTTMLLELAQELLDRAKRDEAEPIPVILDLSTWKGPEQPMVEWLSTELQAKYGLRPDFARKWVEKHQLLPLLDGLDEVAPQHQEVSVLALRAWLTGALEPKPCGVVICCRREEFEQGVWQFLNVYGAIDLKALTPQQIEEYLAQLDLQDVWQTVHQDAALQELLTKPLFLSMFALIATQGKFLAQDWQNQTTSEKKIEYLLDTYWEATIERDLILDPKIKKQGIRSKAYRKKLLPSRQSVRRALVFAAKNLSRDFGADILIENLQPYALQNRQQKWSYRLIFGLFFSLILGLNIGLVSAIIHGLFLGLTHGLIGLIMSLVIDLPFGLTIYLPVSLIMGLMHGLISVLVAYRWGVLDRISFVAVVPALMSRKVQQGTFQMFKTCLMLGLYTNLIIGLFSVLLGSVTIDLNFGLTLGLINFLIFSLNTSLINGLIFSLKANMKNLIKPNQGVKDLLRNMLISSTTSFAVALLLKFFLEYFLGTTFDPKYLLLIFATDLLFLIDLSSYEGGWEAFSQHFALRIVLAWNRYAPFRYDLLLDYCTERLLLQRIGGRYRFMHRLLQDHFAQIDL